MFDFNAFFSGFLTKLKNENRYRVFVQIRRDPHTFPHATLRLGEREQEITIWCSNDYLGMGRHPDTIRAMSQAIERMGAGSGGTRNISGTHCSIVELEREIAEWEGKEAALVFSSGYVANQATLAAIAVQLPSAIFLSDKLNHDSIIQGLKLGGAQKHVFKHNDLAHLRTLLESLPEEAPKVIVFESVYSMEGHFGVLEEVADIAEEFGALTFLDETHAVGLYGPTGAGLAEARGLSDRISIIQGGMGKGIGVVGGFIAASNDIVDFTRSAANGFIFTTSLPPSIAEGARASIRYLRNHNKERQLLQERAAYMKKKLAEHSIPMLPSESHIVPVIVGDAKRCKQISDRLLFEFGHYLQPINFPTVPRGTERLRVTPTPFHTEAMIDGLADALAAVWGIEVNDSFQEASVVLA